MFKCMPSGCTATTSCWVRSLCSGARMASKGRADPPSPAVVRPGPKGARHRAARLQAAVKVEQPEDRCARQRGDWEGGGGRRNLQHAAGFGPAELPSRSILDAWSRPSPRNAGIISYMSCFADPPFAIPPLSSGPIGAHSGARGWGVRAALRKGGAVPDAKAAARRGGIRCRVPPTEKEKAWQERVGRVQCQNGLPGGVPETGGGSSGAV